MGLAINTPKGDAAIELEKKIMAKLCKEYGLVRVSTPSDKPVPFDGILGKEKAGSYVGICCYEFKSRNKSFEYYKDEGVFISKHKIDNGLKSSGLFSIPFVLYFYFYEKDNLYSLAVTDSNGDLLVDVSHSEVRRTQYDTNNEKKKEDTIIYLPSDKFKKIW